MKISVVIPAFNEEKRITPVLGGILGFFKKNKSDFEVIVVSDGWDSTPSVVEAFARKNKVGSKFKVLAFKKRLGKGGALQKGLAAAKGETVFMMDADYSVPANEMEKFLGALKENDVAIGSRYLQGSKAEVPFVRLVFAKSFNLIERILFSLPFNDTQCGFKAFKVNALKKILPRIKTTNFVWDIDMLVQARKLGLKVEEVPVEWHMKEGGTITYLNGIRTALKMFATLLKLRFSD